MTQLSWQRTTEVDLWLEVDGVRIPPKDAIGSGRPGVAEFTLPARVRDVRFVSTMVRPVDIGGVDPRRLGLAIYDMSIAAGPNIWRQLDLDAPGLCERFYSGERTGGLHYRWSRGALAIPSAYFEDLPRPSVLRLSFEASTVRGWRGPPEIMARSEQDRPTTNGGRCLTHLGHGSISLLLFT